MVPPREAWAELLFGLGLCCLDRLSGRGLFRQYLLGSLELGPLSQNESEELPEEPDE